MTARRERPSAGITVLDGLYVLLAASLSLVSTALTAFAATWSDLLLAYYAMLLGRAIFGYDRRGIATAAETLTHRCELWTAGSNDRAARSEEHTSELQS